MSKALKQLITLGVVAVLFGGLLAAYFVLGADQDSGEEITAAEAAQAIVPLRLVEQSESEILRAVFVNDTGTFTIEAIETDDDRVSWIYAGNPDFVLEQSSARNIMRDVFFLTATDMVLESVENPADFGIGRAVATGYFRDGSVEVIRLGSMTPDHSRFYIMREGDPALYLVSTASGNRLIQGIADLVDRELPVVDTSFLRHIYINERGRDPIEFAWYGTEEELEETLTQFGGIWLTMKSPYPGRDLHITNLEMVAFVPFEGFRPGDTVELFPTDLAQYGLNAPRLEFILEDVFEERFHVIIGDDHDDEFVYMMYGDRPHVWLVERRFIEGLLGLNPFRFIDRFVALVPIVDVERVVISGYGRNYDIFINNFEDDNERAQIAPVMNGQEVQDGAFRRFYQTMIAISFDQEIETREAEGPPDVVITYYLNDGGDEGPIVVEFFGYDANFYAVRQYPEPLQFVTSRLGVSVLFDSAERIMAGELDR